jgi:hypothetical protein
MSVVFFCLLLLLVDNVVKGANLNPVGFGKGTDQLVAAPNDPPRACNAENIKLIYSHSDAE